VRGNFFVISLKIRTFVGWERLHAYLQDQRAAALPKTPLGAAVGHTLRNWIALRRYTADGQLKIDNNGAEQALRPIMLGRKN
jgi:transposase